jgi:hypothetical protein
VRVSAVLPRDGGVRAVGPVENFNGSRMAKV